MSRYPELAAKVDGFFARVAARYPNETNCNKGCSHCCHVRLTVTGVEADAIFDEVAQWSDDRKAHLVENEWVKGEWQSELVYAILAREWEQGGSGVRE